MTVHQTSFPTDQPVPPTAAIEALLPAATTAPPQGPATKKLNLRKLLLTGAAIAALAGASWYGWDYWTVGQYLVSTDDAYVKADSTTIAPKVTGYLQQVLVKDNERVATGQVLARIDDRDFRVALDQAKADVAAAEAAIASKQRPARCAADRDRCRESDAGRRHGGGDLRRQENKRYTDLAATGYGSVQNAQHAQARDRRCCTPQSSATRPISPRP